MKYLRIGDVIRHGECEYVVDFVNDCRARCQPLTRGEKTSEKMVKMKSGEWKVERKTSTALLGSRDFSISPVYHESDYVIRRLSAEEMKRFLGKGNASSTQGVTKPEAQETTTETKDESMTTKAKTPKSKTEKRDRPSYKGRSAMIHKLRDSGKKKDEILEAIKKHWPDSTPKVVADVCASKARGNGAPPPKPGKKASAPAKPAAKAKATPPAKAKTPAKAKAATPPAKPTPAAPPAKPSTPPAQAPQTAPSEVASEGEGFQAAA